MQATVLLNHNANIHLEAEEEKYKFLRSLLEQMGVPVAEFWAPDTSLNINNKIKLKETLSAYNIQIYDDLDGHMQIYVENQIIGEFFKPIFKLRRDLRELDPKKQHFLEMKVNYWSVFEEEETS